MNDKISGSKVEGSARYRDAKNRAADYADDPKKLNDLLDRAARKAEARKAPLREVWDSLTAMLRLLRAYAAGRYRDVPWSSLLSIIAVVVYFVMPADMIPDFLLGWGFIDDAALLAWILGSVRSDLDRFLDWEADAGERLEPMPDPASDGSNR